MNPHDFFVHFATHNEVRCTINEVIRHQRIKASRFSIDLDQGARPEKQRPFL
jgi:hypothetical protein